MASKGQYTLELEWHCLAHGYGVQRYEEADAMTLLFWRELQKEEIVPKERYVMEVIPCEQCCDGPDIRRSLYKLLKAIEDKPVTIAELALILFWIQGANERDGQRYDPIPAIGLWAKRVAHDIKIREFAKFLNVVEKMWGPEVAMEVDQIVAQRHADSLATIYNHESALTAGKKFLVDMEKRWKQLDSWTERHIAILVKDSERTEDGLLTTVFTDLAMARRDWPTMAGITRAFANEIRSFSLTQEQLDDCDVLEIWLEDLRVLVHSDHGPLKQFQDFRKVDTLAWKLRLQALKLRSLCHVIVAEWLIGTGLRMDTIAYEL